MEAPAKGAKTKESPFTPLALSDDGLPVAEVLEQVGESALALAWVKGEIEFGRRNHCVTGNPDAVDTSSPNVKSALVFEEGMNWSGEKTKNHAQLKKIIAEADVMPRSQIFQKYIWKEVEGSRPKLMAWHREDITKAEAAKLWTLYVRLTDKGLAALGSTN